MWREVVSFPATRRGSTSAACHAQRSRGTASETHAEEPAGRAVRAMSSGSPVLNQRDIVENEL
jgi:hypothetical protein